MIQAYNGQGMTEAAKNLENMMITAKDTLGTLQFQQTFLWCNFYVLVLFYFIEKWLVYLAFLGM
jgi:hypothetical protein